MTTVSTNILIGAVIAGVAAAAFTLVPRLTAEPSSHQSDANISAEVNQPKVTEGVVENPPEVKVNGVEVPVKEGTTRVHTGQGTASVTVTDDSMTVNADSAQSSTPSSLDISVQSHSSIDAGSDGSERSRTRSTSSVRSSSSSTNSSHSSVKIETRE